jgi:hypothetical protein
MVGDLIGAAGDYAAARGLLPLKVRADFAAPKLKAKLERDLT